MWLYLFQWNYLRLTPVTASYAVKYCGNEGQRCTYIDRKGSSLRSQSWSPTGSVACWPCSWTIVTSKSSNHQFFTYWMKVGQLPAAVQLFLAQSRDSFQHPPCLLRISVSVFLRKYPFTSSASDSNMLSSWMPYTYIDNSIHNSLNKCMLHKIMCDWQSCYTWREMQHPPLLLALQNYHTLKCTFFSFLKNSTKPASATLSQQRRKRAISL